MDVQLPDGRILTGIPEGTTRAQIEAKIGRVAQPEQSKQPEQKFSLGNIAGRTLRAGVTGLATPATMIADPLAATLNYVTGQNGALPSERLQQAMTDLGIASPQTPGQRIADSAATALAGAGSMIGVGRAISQQAPNAAMRVVPSAREAIGRALASAPMTQGGAAVGSAAAGGAAREAGMGPIAEVAANLAGGTIGGRVAGRLDKLQPVRPPRAMTAEDLRRQSQASYENARQSGAIINDSAVNQFIDNEAAGLGVKTPAGRVIAGGQDPYSVVYGRLTQLRDRPLSIDEVDDIDKVLTRQVDNFTENGRIRGEGLPILQLRNQFRQFVSNLTPDQVAGGQEGFDALKNARADWARSMRLGEVERIMDRKDLYAQDSTAIANGFRALYQNRDKMAGFSPEERSAVRRAASQTGPIMDAIKPLSSRLMSMLTGAAGGPAGYVAGLGISNASRGIADTLQMRRAQAVADIIANGRPMQVSQQDPQRLARMLGIAIGGNQ